MKFPIHKINQFLERYPGLEELVEEFEHLSLAREDEDGEAIAYFKAQRRLRLRDEQNGQLASAFSTDTIKTEVEKGKGKGKSTFLQY